ALVDVHDLGSGDIHRRDVLLAAGTHALGEPLASSQGEASHHELHQRVAYDAAEPLIGMIVGTQQVAVHQQYAPAVDIDQRAIRQQLDASLTTEAFADEEVAIAVNQEGFHASVGDVSQAREDAALVRVGIVVADPRFEQVAENVQRLRASAL